MRYCMSYFPPIAAARSLQSLRSYFPRRCNQRKRMNTPTSTTIQNSKSLPYLQFSTILPDAPDFIVSNPSR